MLIYTLNIPFLTCVIFLLRSVQIFVQTVTNIFADIFNIFDQNIIIFILHDITRILS